MKQIQSSSTKDKISVLKKKKKNICTELGASTQEIKYAILFWPRELLAKQQLQQPQKTMENFLKKKINSKSIQINQQIVRKE